MRFQNVLHFLSMLLIYFHYANIAVADETTAAKEKSVHLGLMHPNGVDVAGYSVEKSFSNNIYSFYNFGIPSFAAAGFTYYEERKGNGFSATAGVGLGFVLYGSAAYQWKIDPQNYLKFGAGLVAGVAYSGIFPVMSYEYRFEK